MRSTLSERGVLKAQLKNKKPLKLKELRELTHKHHSMRKTNSVAELREVVLRYPDVCTLLPDNYVILNDAIPILSEKKLKSTKLSVKVKKVDKGVNMFIIKKAIRRGMYRKNIEHYKTLAEQIGMTHTVISAMINGKRKAGVKTLNRFADFFGVSLAEFCSWGEEK